MQFNCTSTEQVFNIWRVNNTIPSVNDELAERGVVVCGVQALETSGMFSSSLSIPARSDNDNTSIRCSAIDTNSDPIVSASSKVVFLNIQGLLDPPPNLTLSVADDGLSKILTCDAPKMLDITGVDPDIQSYQICYNLTSNDNLTCLNVSSLERREFKFLNVRVPLLFAVAAINVVGIGDTSSTVHQPSGCDIKGRTIHYIYIETVSHHHHP